MHEAILGVVRPDHRSPDYLEPGPVYGYARKCGGAFTQSQVKSSQVKSSCLCIDLT